jgi:hypothetical protein
MKNRRTTCLFVTFASVFISAIALAADQPKDLDTIPRRVLDALSAKFPNATIEKWTKERERGKTIYDLEFTAAGRKAEADIAEDGSIQNFETQFDADRLPKAVTDAVARKYPKSTIKEVLEVTEIKNRKEVPGGFEIVIETAGKKEVELTIARSGKILEDSGPRSPERK